MVSLKNRYSAYMKSIMVKNRNSLGGIVDKPDHRYWVQILVMDPERVIYLMDRYKDITLISY